jgi:hypothetical protein
MVVRPFALTIQRKPSLMLLGESCRSSHIQHTTICTECNKLQNKWKKMIPEMVIWVNSFHFSVEKIFPPQPPAIACRPPPSHDGFWGNALFPFHSSHLQSHCTVLDRPAADA